jgi:hypothetical protein
MDKALSTLPIKLAKPSAPVLFDFRTRALGQWAASVAYG